MTAPPSAPDLVARLRAIDDCSKQASFDAVFEAAAEIERLTLGWEKTAKDQQQEIERLRAESEDLEKDLAYYKRDWKENDRLRAALEKIDGLDMEAGPTWAAAYKHAKAIAREALRREADQVYSGLRGAGEKP